LTRRLKIDNLTTASADFTPVVDILLNGGVIAGPTETFYGLMAASDQPEALIRIQAMKGRDGRKPFLLLIDDTRRLPEYARDWPWEADLLMNAFWPGPLTLLFHARPDIPDPLIGPDQTVGLRREGLPVIRELVRNLERAVTGTSANPTGCPPAATADEAAEYFGGQLDLILDGGPAAGGKPTTIIDVSRHPLRLVREGTLSIQRIRAVIPDLVG
jgi:L-threonylcarbamoyladenylate synthase